MKSPENYQDEAYSSIKRMVITFKLKPGQRVTIKTLQDELDIGTTPIREAIIRLRREGLFLVIPQSGTYVSKINMDEVYQARFVRENLESLVFSEATEEIDDYRILKLKEIIELQKIYLKSKNYNQFFELDEKFHRSFYLVTNKEYIWNWLQLLNAQFNRFRYLRLEISGLNWDKILQQHKDIIEAVEDRNLDSVKLLVTQHLHLVDSDCQIVMEKMPEYFEKNYSNNFF